MISSIFTPWKTTTKNYKMKFTKEEVLILRECILNEGNSEWMLFEDDILHMFSKDEEIDKELNHHELEALLKVTQWYVVLENKESMAVKNQLHKIIHENFQKLHSI